MSYSIKSLVRLTVVSLSFATLMPGATTWAGPPDDASGCHDHQNKEGCGGSGDDSSPSENLSAAFCLTIDGSDNYILSDGGSQPPLGPDEYCHDKKKKVAAFTGSGDGFRWDTNMQNTNKQPQWMRWRWVHLNIVEDPGSLPHDEGFDKQGNPIHPSDIFEIDFRFNQTNGLDLGSLVSDGAPGYVAATIRYYAGHAVGDYDFKNYGILGFGGVNTPFPMNQDDLACLNAVEVDDDGNVPGMIKVTKTSVGWTLESPEIGTACRFSLDAGGNKCTFTNPCNVNDQEPAEIDFDFKFTITQQD